MKTKCKHCNGTGEVEVFDKDVSDCTVRRMDFSDEINKLKKGYSDDILNEFFNYWTETNKSKKKMRFEGERFFDIKRRLKTWVKNNEQWNQKKVEPKLVSSIKLPKNGS